MFKKVENLEDFALVTSVKVEKMFQSIRETISNEEGTLKDLTWVIGAAVVVALIIVGAMTYAPSTAQTFWSDATKWIKKSFKF